MLSPYTDRLDYGEKLQAPEGFTLSHGLATTYSLDLETLLCLPLALSFNSTLEGDLQGEKLALLEGISQLKGKVKVFFQQGNIKLPSQFNLLFSLLEPYLVPRVPGEAFSSFHPKIWLLRFTNEDREVRYRLLVLSRNLTFDRSWDLAVALEGNVSGDSSRENDGLLELLQELAPHAKDFSAAFNRFKKELPTVIWQKPPGFSGLRTLLGRPEQVPLEFGGGTDTVLVMSPFIHYEALDMLKQRGQRHWLFSRAEELERIGAERLNGWDCFALNSCLVSGEDELTRARAQNLHAKLVLLQNGSTSHWHIGSANATKAALGGLQSPPRNTEFMLRLSSSGTMQSAEQLKVELVGTEQEPTGIFTPHTFGSLLLQEPLATDKALRELLHQLIKADWCMRATTDANNTFTCVIDCPQELLALSSSIEAQPLVAGQSRALEPRLVWEGLSLTQISSFLILRVKSSPDVVTQLLIKVRLDIEGGDTREQKITSSLIDSPHKLLAYIQMLLQPDHERTEWPTGGGGAHENVDALLSHMLGGPIHEALLRCAARQPEKLQRIDAVLAHLREIENLIPKELSTLWLQYQKFPWKKKA
ncbi:hypothetical protein [Pseudomonas sp. GL-B-26]|uniref:hypothetical protein n=1 Tax=Pseudomonas sp. GL-B-26 TaxID=2832394 RepID=UPI001CBAA2D2|nr:hypothetical protein [Pseudomonas sp. GL-B-26]